MVKVPQKLQGNKLSVLMWSACSRDWYPRPTWKNGAEEIRQRQDVILALHEIHEIVGAGNAGDGGMLETSLTLRCGELHWSEQQHEYRIIEKALLLSVSYATS